MYFIYMKSTLKILREIDDKTKLKHLEENKWKEIFSKDKAIKYARQTHGNSG